MLCKDMYGWNKQPWKEKEKSAQNVDKWKLENMSIKYKIKKVAKKYENENIHGHPTKAF